MDSSQAELALHGLQVVQVSLAVLSGNDLNGSVDDFVNGLELDSLHGSLDHLIACLLYTSPSPRDTR